MTHDGTSQTDGVESTTQHEDPSSDVETKPVKKRRWFRRIAILFVLLFFLLVGVVASAPYLLSTTTATQYAGSFIGRQIGSEVTLEKVSLSWFDDCKVEGLTVADAQGRNILNSGSIDIPGGVWGLLKRLDIPENVRIDSPSVVLYLDQAADDSASSDTRDDDAPTQEALQLSGIKVVVRNGRVTIVGAPSSDSGTENPVDYVLDDINVDLTLGSSGQLTASVSGRSPEGATLQIDATLDDALELAASDLDPETLSGSVGSVRISSDKPFDLQTLTSALPREYRASGQVMLDVDVRVEGGVLDSKLDVKLVDIAASGFDGADGLPPGRLGLTGSVRVDQQTATGRFDLEGDAGIVDAEFTWPYLEADSMPGADAFAEAVMAGRMLELPNLVASVSGNVDLAVLSQAFPGLLRLKSDVALKEGVLNLHALEISGGQQPAAKLVASLKDVLASTPTGAIQWEPASVELDVATSEDGDLAVRRAYVDVAALKLEGSGDINGLTATISGDLDRLHRRISPMIDLGIDELSGQFNSQIELSRMSQDRVGISCDVSGKQIRYRSGTDSLDLPIAEGRTRLDARLVDGNLVEVKLNETKIDLGGQIVVSATGVFDAIDSGFSFDVAAPQIQLSRVATILEGFGVDEEALRGGSLSGVAHLERANANAPILTNGEFSARDVQVEAATHRADISWNGVRLDLLASTVFVESASLESAIAAVDLGQCELGYGDEFKLAGQVKGRADLRKCAKLLAGDGDQSALSSLAGHLVFDANCKADAGKTTLRGQASVNDFAMQTTDGTVIKDKLVALYDVQINTASDTISLDKFTLTSDVASVDIAGKLDAFSAEQVANLDGKLSFDWSRIMQMCYELYPETRELISIAGRSDSGFQVRGPLNRSDRSPPFRDAAISAQMGWDSAEVFGIPLGRLTLKPSLREGNLTLPLTKISAAGGQVQLGGVVEFGSQSPVLRIPGRLAVLKGIEVTPRLGEQLLSRFNPIFGGATQMAGSLDLTVNEVSLPMGDAMYTGGSGSGRLDMRQFKVTPSAFMITLLELGGMGQPQMYTVNVSGMDFVVGDGRISYEDFTLAFADQQFDLKFRGSVGFDNTLDLFVSVPVQENLLRRLKVKGPVGEYAARLAGTRVEIPITGSRSNPKLDFSKVNVDSLLKDVIKDTLLNPNSLLDALGKATGDKKGAKSKGSKARGKGGKKKGRGNRAKGKEKSGLGGLLGGVLKEGKGKGEAEKETGKKKKGRKKKGSKGKRKSRGRKRSSER